MNALDDHPKVRALGKLLLIDDDISVIKTLQLLFSSDFETVAATSAEEGMEKFHSEQPSVVILDYKLPDGTGIEVLRKIRETDQDTSVMLLTAFATPDMVEEAKQLGISDFVSKPFDARQFRDRVACLFNQRRERTAADAPVEYPVYDHSQAEIFFHDAANAVTCLVILSEMLRFQVADGAITSSDSISDEVALISENVQYLRFLFERWRAFPKGPIHTHEVSDTRRAIDFAVNRVTHLIKDTIINLQIEVEVNVPGFRGTQAALVQVLINLLNNAIEAVSPINGQIVVSAASTGSLLRIIISDNGRGIQQADQQKIFERSFSTKGDGRGLGLYSCRRSIELLKGSLTFQSPGRLGGTDFIINLPFV